MAPSDNPNGDKEELLASPDKLELEMDQIEADVNKLNSIISGDTSMLGGEDVAELLARLSSADEMVQDVDGKLDKVISHLDELLASLGVDGDEVDTAEGNTNPAAAPTNHAGNKDQSSK